MSKVLRCFRYTKVRPCIGDDYENINELLNKIEDHNREALLNSGVVIACGTAMYKKGDTVTDVYKRADEAMYENKARLKKGREVR